MKRRSRKGRGSARRPDKNQETVLGRVIGRQGPVFMVETEEEARLACVARGKGKRSVVGDLVRFIDHADTDLARGLIIDHEPRESELIRADALGRRAQAIAANLDRIFVVVANEPPLREGLIDRYLVTAEAQGLETHIVFNKVDLIAEDPDAIAEIGHRLAAYPPLGYPVHFVSAATGHGIAELRDALADQCSIFVGHSGVGKTSLLNVLCPGLAEPVNVLSAASGRGQHTTTTAQMYRLDNGGEVIDSPGIRSFGLWGMPTEDVRLYFVEFNEISDECRFSDCQHIREPKCAVLAALEEGAISEVRYASYLRIRDSLDAPDPRL